jgi:hypothetical protein
MHIPFTDARGVVAMPPPTGAVPNLPSPGYSITIPPESLKSEFTFTTPPAPPAGASVKLPYQGMSYGDVMIALQEGMTARRIGWDNAFLAPVKSHFIVARDPREKRGWHPSMSSASAAIAYTEVAVSDFIGIWDTKLWGVTPYSPPQQDMLATDWVIE